MYQINQPLDQSDEQIAQLIQHEAKRQEDHIELIASENYVSRAILEAQGSILTNKYAEGYPNKRYYGGCINVDLIEQLAIDRACELFNAEYANVQPHSGSQANQAVYFATLKPGDTILGMSLDQGGHLTHGSPVNLSGKTYNCISYELDTNEQIDYEQVERLALQHKPKLIIAGASAYSLAIDFKKFRQIADKSGSLLMVDMAHYAGLIAAGLYPNPVEYADFVTSTTHKTLRGARGGLILAKKQHAKLINSAIFPGIQGGPLEHIIAAKAVTFKEALQPEFRAYQQQVKDNALAMANEFKRLGVRVISGTTESHMMLLDLRNLNISGKLAEEILGRANITLNKNSIPNDPQSAFITSGIRIGSPAITTRGFKQPQSIQVVQMIIEVLNNPNNIQIIDKVKQQALQLCSSFPVYK